MTDTAPLAAALHDSFYQFAPRALFGPDLARELPAILKHCNKSIDVLCFCMSPRVSTTSARQRALHDALYQAPAHVGRCRAIFATASIEAPGASANARSMQQLKETGWLVRAAPTRPLLHAKLWILDEVSIILGSHNLTDAALHQNLEASIITGHARTVSAALHYFERIWRATFPNGENNHTD